MRTTADEVLSTESGVDFLTASAPLGERSDDDTESNRDRTPRNGDVDELSEPWGLLHPDEESSEWITVCPVCAYQIPFGGEITQDFLDTGIEEREADNEA